MKRIIYVLLALMLVGCNEKEIDNPIEETYIEPLSYLDHDEYEVMPTSNDLQDLGTCYEIFPISFADSNDDGYGDINGIRENLDYLVDLGVQCLWITPVTESNSYHKYDVIDYKKIDPMFGTNEDYNNLLLETEELGIKVLMDLVLNHTSSMHPWFIASQDETSEYREYYRWADLKNKTSYPSYDGWHREGDLYYYGSFWDQMPDLNLDNPLVREELFEIAEYWTQQGVDGFRLDAAKHYFDINEYPRGTATINENITFLREFNYRVKSINENAIVLAEVWSDASVVAKYFAGTDTSFNFELAEDIANTLNNGSDIGLVQNLISTREELMEARSDFVDSIFLSNHDQTRVLSRLGDDLAKAKVAANILFTLPGTSWIYYGEELGMTGYGPHEHIRQPMIWDNDYQAEGHTGGVSSVSNDNLELLNPSEQLLNEDSMLNHYKDLIELKNDEVFKYGTLLPVEKENRKLVSYIRSYEDKYYLVINSISMLDQEVNMNDSILSVIYNHNVTIVENTLTLSPFGTIIIEVDNIEITF